MSTLGNLTDDVLDRVARDPGSVAIAHRRAGTWVDITITTFHRAVVDAAKGLHAAGVGPGDRVALLSKTRYEWTLLDYAIWWIGASTVPIYETSSVEQIRWILRDSGAVACIAESAEHAARVEQAHSDAPALASVWVIDEGAVKSIGALGQDVDDDSVEALRAAITSDTVATLIYTSGTTGRPKGCVLTHGNFRFELDGAISVLDDLFSADGASTLLFLPLAHVFARVIQVGAIRSDATLGHTADVADLVTHLGEFHPSFILAVPRVFEKVFNTASQRAYADGKGKIFDAAVRTAIAYSKKMDSGRRAPLVNAKHKLFDRLVYSRLRTTLGGRATHALSGGAPLGDRLAHFYRGIGLPILEGYGLTESTAALSVNSPQHTKIGTVGRPLPGTEVAVADDGELLFRGRQVFSGYWGDEAATRAVLDDGWLATGDLGDVDDDGFVRITGRKKEILVTAGGKNVAPAVLEDLVRAHPYVSQCLVVGDKMPFIAALVTIDQEAYDGGRHDPKLVDAVQKAVNDANAHVSRAESIRKFAILDDDWTEVNGYLTPSFKVRRNRVMADFHDQVEALFSR